MENCDNAILAFKNLEAGLKKRYLIELEKIANNEDGYLPV
jgi:hypothetical protein